MSSKTDILSHLIAPPTTVGLTPKELAEVSTGALMLAENRLGRESAEKLYAAVWDADAATSAARTLALALLCGGNSPVGGTYTLSSKLSSWGWHDLEPRPTSEWMVRNFNAAKEVMTEETTSGFLAWFVRKELISCAFLRGEDIGTGTVRRIREMLVSVSPTSASPSLYGVTASQLLDTLDVGDKCGDDILAGYVMLLWSPVEERDYALESLVKMRDGGVPVKAAYEILTTSMGDGRPDIARLIADWNSAAGAGLPLELIESLFGLEEGKLSEVESGA